MLSAQLTAVTALYNARTNGFRPATISGHAANTWPSANGSAGAAIGAGVGAVGGALVGGEGAAVTGALIGTGVGAVGGSLMSDEK